MSNIVWESVVNKSGKRVEICETNVDQVAQEVVQKMKSIFGVSPLDWSDDVWEQFINPWIMQYSQNFFKFNEFVTFSDLDEAINSILDSEVA